MNNLAKMKQTENQKIQLALHEERIANLSTDVKLILTNHLPHIQEAIEKGAEKTDERFNSIERKLAYWGGAIAVIIIIAQLIIPLILKN